MSQTGEIHLTRRGKLVLALLILLVLAVAAAIGGFIYLRSIGVLSASDPGEKVKIEIPEGASLVQIGEMLQNKDVIVSAFGLRVAAYLESGNENIQAGTYRIATGLSARDALDALLKGPIVEFVTVTFPEGSWLTDFARIVDEDTHISGDEFLALATSGEIRSKYQPRSVDSLEGLLFPSTYQVIADDTAETLLKRLVSEFEKRADAIALDQGAQTVGLTPYEAIIVASMIEAEAQVAEERAMMSRVMYNRLEAGDLLGIDATVNYAIQDHKLDLTVSELDVDSPYNTRRYAGLPPTPIGAAGEESLKAAINPAPGDWYFYVLADCEGNHAFSETSAEFAQDKAAYEALDC
jgi:UPF0755 protein